MIVTYGEIMLRLSPRDKGERLSDTTLYRVAPGGSEANVAVALAALGNEVSFVTRMPDNPLARRVERYLRSHNVGTRQIVWGGDRLGIYWTENGVGPRPSNVIYDRGNSAFAKVSPGDVLPALREAAFDWFHVSGITAAISQESFATLVSLLDELDPDIRVSVDLNYRAKLWQWLERGCQNVEELRRCMRRVCKNAVLITGNETDFEQTLGMTSNADDEVERYREYAAQAFESFEHLRHVAISLRKARSASEVLWSGLLFVREHQGVSCCRAPRHLITDIVDRVGTGDSFTAGIIHGLLHFEEDWQKTLEFAVGLSALNHTCTGDASRFCVEDVQHFTATSGDGRIVR